MNLNLLRTFVTIVEEGNFSKAAQKLHLSQPAVSMQMQTLASELELNLFLKVGKKIQLTEGGSLLYENGKELLLQWNQIIGKLEIYKKDISGKLKIGASSIPGLYFLPKTIKKFKEKHPKSEFDIKIEDSQAIIDELIQGNIDIAFIGKRVNKSGVSCYRWMKDKLVLVKPKDYPMPSKVTLKELNRYPQIVRRSGSGTRNLVEEKLKEKGIKLEELPIALELDSTESVISAVEAGIGISFISEIAAKRGVSLDTLEIVDIDLSLDRDLFYVFRNGNLNSNLCENFILHLEQRG